MLLFMFFCEFIKWKIKIFSVILFMDKIKNKKIDVILFFLYDYIIVLLVIFKIVYEKYNDFCLEWIWNEKEIKKNIESVYVLCLIFIIY